MVREQEVDTKASPDCCVGFVQGVASHKPTAFPRRATTDITSSGGVISSSAFLSVSSTAAGVRRVPYLCRSVIAASEEHLLFSPHFEWNMIFGDQRRGRSAQKWPCLYTVMAIWRHPVTAQNCRTSALHRKPHLFRFAFFANIAFDRSEAAYILSGCNEGQFVQHGKPS